MRKEKKLKKFPSIRSDEEAERFVAEEDLSEYDFSDFRPMSEFFEFKPKDKSVHLRLPEALLNAVKDRASKEGMPYQRYMRRALEIAIAQSNMNNHGREKR